MVTSEVPLNQYLSTKLHGVTPQQTLIFILCDYYNICNELYVVHFCGCVVGCKVPLSQLFCLGQTLFDAGDGVVFVSPGNVGDVCHVSVRCTLQTVVSFVPLGVGTEYLYTVFTDTDVTNG